MHHGNTLTHTHKTEARFPGLPRIKSGAIVTDFKKRMAILLPITNFNSGRVRMATDVGHTFLQDPEQRRCNISFHPAIA